jgi:hypothetical protein
MANEIDPNVEAMLRYIQTLESAILISMEEIRQGNFGYGMRVLSCMESRILMAHEAGEQEAEQARRMIH